LEQLHSFSALDRDPRGRTISVVFWGILKNNQQAQAGDDARSARWFPIDQLPDLAFDHTDVVEMAIRKLKSTIFPK
jgi:8-oxo-dGTP diphosphatase